jgi:putative transcriptional regulator
MDHSLNIALAAGMLIESTAALDDTVFAGVTIFLSAYNEKGAMGFIVNQPFGRSLHELAAFSRVPAFPLYHGGPVDEEHLYFLYCRPDLIPGGRQVFNDIYTEGDFEQAVRLLEQGQLKRGDIKIFVGYCGWDTGELEAEIAEGSWLVHPVEKDSAASLLASVFQ